MMDQITKDITQYISYFHSEHEKILRVAEPLHRKLLIVAVLATLAEGRYPNLDGDSLKFMSLVENESDWADAKKISVSELYLRTKNDRHIPNVTTPFVENVSNLYRQWRKGRNAAATIELDQDFQSDGPLQATTDKERKLIQSAKHSALLYLYRCKLVHEFREPGHPAEVFGDHRPYYHSMIDLETKEQALELVYPAKWFASLVPSVLSSLERYYFAHRINPYNSYRFGSPWTK